MESNHLESFCNGLALIPARRAQLFDIEYWIDILYIWVLASGIHYAS